MPQPFDLAIRAVDQGLEVTIQMSLAPLQPLGCSALPLWRGGERIPTKTACHNSSPPYSRRLTYLDIFHFTKTLGYGCIDMVGARRGRGGGLLLLLSNSRQTSRKEPSNTAYDSSFHCVIGLYTYRHVYTTASELRHRHGARPPAAIAIERRTR